MHEYGTVGQLNGDELGAHAMEFQSFVTDTVVPLLRKRYQVARRPAQVAVMGASLGGLSAFEPRVAAAGCVWRGGLFSGSFLVAHKQMPAPPSSRPHASSTSSCAQPR